MNSDTLPLKEIFKSSLDILFPRTCLLCGKINPSGKFAHFCDDCSPEHDILRGARCLRCSEIIGTVNDPDMPVCPHCRDNPPKFKHSLVAGSFTNAIRQMIIELKYHNGTYILREISQVLKSVKGAEVFFKNAVLVPVPLHYTRLLKRGYNQSELLCKTIKKTFPQDAIQIKNLLKRTHRTPTQTTLDKTHRAKNVKNAFSIAAINLKLANIAESARIVVVDDVMTSGATLSECAAVLRRAGFENVDAFAFGRRL